MRARESVTGTLDDIESGALSAAGAFETAGQAADAFGRDLDDVEDQAAATARELTDAATGALEAATAFSVTEGRADELGDEFSEATFEAGALAGVLSSMPAADALAGEYDTDIRADINNASFMAARAAIESLPDSHVVDVAADVDRDSFSIPQLAGGTVPFAAGGLSAPSVSPDSQTVPFEAGGMGMPDLSALQFPATDGGAELTALGGGGHVAAEGLNAASEAAIETSAMAALAAESADEAGDSLMSSVPGGEAMAGALDSVRNSAAGVVPGMTAAASATDEYGDEASEAVAETAALQASMAGIGGSGVGTEILGFHGSVSSLVALLPALIALVGGLAAPLGAATAGALGAGGAFAAMFGAGLLSQGEEMVGTLQMVDGELKRIESSGEGAKVVLGDIKDRAAGIFSELQTAQTGDFFSGIVEGGFTVLEDFVAFTNRQMDDLSAMGDRLGDAFAIEEPRFFAELDATTQAILPGLENAAEWLLGAIPDGLKWVQEEGLETAGMFVDLAGSTLSALVEFAELGGAIWSVLGPALGFVLDTTTGVLDAFNDLPGPIKTFAVAGALAAGAFYLLAGGAVAASGATTVLGAVSAAALAPVGALATAVGVLTSPLFLAAVAIGAVVGAGALLINHFGLMDDIVGGLESTWNALVGGIEWAANAFLGIADAVSNALGPFTLLIPVIGPLLWLLGNLGDILDWVGGAFQWAAAAAAGAWGDLTSYIGGLVGRISGWFERMLNDAIGIVNSLIDTANKIPGIDIKTRLEPVDLGDAVNRAGDGPVDLGGMKVGQGGTAAQDARGGPGGPQGPQQPPGPGGPGAGAGGYGSGSGAGYGGGAAGGTAAATGGGGGTTVKNEVHYYEQNGDATSGPARERRVRNIVRQMNSESRRSGTGLN